MQPDLESIVDEHRDYLNGHPLPKTELARRIGFSYSWLWKFCAGKIRNPTVNRAARLSRWIDADRRKRLAA
jgi:transcriptional regulator with XRE-family HTH domain